MLRAAAAVLVALASVTAAMSCAGAARPVRHSSVRLAVRTQLPAPETLVLAGGADVVAGGLAHELFASAPAVIVASPDRPAELAAAARSALRAHAPLLLASAQAGRAVVSAMLRAQIKGLDPRAVLAVGVPGKVLAAALPGIRVVTDPAAIAALAAARPRRVLAVGAGFGPASRLASRVAAAQTGVQLPGGGQLLFPGRLLVALYGHPDAPALGALGQQGVETGAGAVATAADRQREHQRGQQRHQMAGRPHRALPAAAEAPGAAPVPAVDDRDEQELDTRHQDLAILIHMDGQGTPADKQQTWQAITTAAPAGVFFGWKNFYAKDHPVMSPRQTMARIPRLSMISYQ